MIRPPQPFEFHTNDDGCYFITNSVIDTFTMYSLITNTIDYEQDVKAYVEQFTHLNESTSEFNVLIIDLNTNFQLYEALAIRVLASGIAYPCCRTLLANNYEDQQYRIKQFQAFVRDFFDEDKD